VAVNQVPPAPPLVRTPPRYVALAEEARGTIAQRAASVIRRALSPLAAELLIICCRVAANRCGYTFAIIHIDTSKGSVCFAESGGAFDQSRTLAPQSALDVKDSALI
jgi:hypothetical protein